MNTNVQNGPVTHTSLKGLKGGGGGGKSTIGIFRKLTMGKFSHTLRACSPVIVKISQTKLKQLTSETFYLSFRHVKHASIFSFQERFSRKSQLLVNSLKNGDTALD